MSDLIKDINFVGEEVDKKAVTCEVKVTDNTAAEGQRKLYIESYGCQMNFSDSEIVASVMQENNFGTTNDVEEADLVFLNTCSIREKAEQTVRKRLTVFNKIKKRKPGMIIGVLGCMAERLKTQLLEEEKMVDIVAGPDAYRDLPKLVGDVDEGDKGVNVFLSRDETYADIAPIRLNSNGITAMISIMRGCDNMCSFCVVPFTRGRERSRDPHSIVQEAKELFEQGYKEVTLLGQNVDSYKWSGEENNKARLEKKEKEEEVEEVVNFANLLEMVAQVSPELRIRFSTSHPKDITDEVLYTMKKYENICKFIHLPVQSGNSRVLDIMNRTYDREWYINRIDKIREILGNECGVSSDMIAGFCTETEEEHKDTLSLMEYVKFDFSYMFFYSERPGTLAEKKFEDDIPEEVKKRRLQEIVTLQRIHSAERNALNVGQTQKVLIEGYSKRSQEHFQGRNSANKVVVFPKGDAQIGTYAHVKVHDCTGGTLLGELVEV
ncbi:tRNA (N6-isopentenyl adenosine(37)-C2)-methylthiotransferase MiaB [Flammeovirga agarivorans]|uniref:tRNA-2-methylthio-N(6)-dimethylallyladenosine synthase n=1 Tax=Flammeovirga agarivorans TaxID=2726742 RepID=A0A7X8SR90_9BACT|nr:tRNA (N6-isopentenyl adenosine(37)-C2)-methylthiotransferase MiaB [Flammeovirga agarivorans]NLR94808.1 tRNA (N6-isopentenyl adenosine(37)-C2)-methylthiotransferase MiaB [Flammeovirga agarivorans]